MGFTWITGDPQNVPVTWLGIDNICAVNKEKELLTFTVEVITEELDGAGFFDDIEVLKNLINEKIEGNELVHLLFEQLSAGTEIEVPIFGALKDCQIAAAHIIPKGKITGNDTDYCTLKLVNQQTSEVIASKTFLAGVDAPAFEITDFAAISGTVQIAGQTLALVKENHGSGLALPEMLLIIEWDLA